MFLYFASTKRINVDLVTYDGLIFVLGINSKFQASKSTEGTQVAEDTKGTREARRSSVAH